MQGYENDGGENRSEMAKGMSMSNKFRAMPVEVEAHRWEKNGDHPLDRGGETEGDLVRYFRTPDTDGERVCKSCGVRMHCHGWIDTAAGSYYIVCPGDWIVTDPSGGHFPCRPDRFEALYEAAGGDRGEVSDGYHTFNELYRHRHALFLALLRAHGGWACRVHADGTMFDGHFIAGMDIGTDGDKTIVGHQITYHLPLDLWAIVEDMGIVVEAAPAWDGHAPDDVVLRLLEYAMQGPIEGLRIDPHAGGVGAGA